MLKKILIGAAALLAVLAAVIYMQPDDFRVERSATINAAPAVVFEQVNSLQNWNAWSPWAKLDPNAVTTFEGPDAGTGAVTRWKGNSEVGEGSMTITESTVNELVRIRLDFLKPFENTAMADFTFRPEAGGTVVTWSMYGKNNYLSKAIGLIMNCDKMMGGYFEEGLKNLKGVVETAAAVPAETAPSAP